MRWGFRLLCLAYATVLLVPFAALAGTHVAGDRLVVVAAAGSPACSPPQGSVTCLRVADVLGLGTVTSLALLLGIAAIAGARAPLTLAMVLALVGAGASMLFAWEARSMALPFVALATFCAGAAAAAGLARPARARGATTAAVDP